MAKAQPWKDEGMNKPDWVAKEVAKAVNAGKQWDLETVDFSDPNRPLTCLEVDFPIIPINQIAAIEGNAGKPIYQMSKWWARRRSSVFRSMLLAAAMKAPDDPSEAAKLVWDVYYGNHQAKGTFKNLKVADIFMGGGTTVVEGSRLGMQMYGNDLNPVAWFVVKNELAQVDKAEVQALLDEIEAEVKPQIMPFYATDCPRGHKGKWTQVSTGKVMGADFDQLALTPDERKDYSYQGPEVIYTFWAKHGPCSVTGCGHRTPIMSSPVMAVKEIGVKYLDCSCPSCDHKFHAELGDARMAPGEPFIVAEGEHPYTTLSASFASMLQGYENGNADEKVARLGRLMDAVESESGLQCPRCATFSGEPLRKTLNKHAASKTMGARKKKDLKLKPAGSSSKTIQLSLIVHPDWLKGEGSTDEKGQPYGGSADDPVEDTIRWNRARAKNCKLVEVRGVLPDEVTLDDGTNITTGNNGGTVPKKSHFTCAECGTAADVLKTMTAYGHDAPNAPFAHQCYCPICESESQPYSGRFFEPASQPSKICEAEIEWKKFASGELKDYWPKSPLPDGFKTTYQRIPEHGYPNFASLFNSRQLLTHTRLLKAIAHGSSHSPQVRNFVLGAFQQFLRNACMFSFWHRSHDHFAPALSNNNYHPKPVMIEVGPFCPIGYGPWPSTLKSLPESLDWKQSPWEIVSNERVEALAPQLQGVTSGKGTRVKIGDPVLDNAEISCGSSTNLEHIADQSCDLVITDPPFGNNIQYSELADFFYVWLRLVLSKEYGEYIPEYTPKAQEAVTNPARNQDDPEAFFARLLKECWGESNRILKTGGLLAFTFHHSEDAPWVSVLTSLFDAGFILHATLPIRSDETKGEGAKPGTFGSQLIEYDVVHVCRKRLAEPSSISWAKLRRQVLHDVRELKDLLEHHSEEGLPEADLQVIRRGKALEYFSRHYGKVYKDHDTPMTVPEALLGINQLLDEEAGGAKEAPPHNAEPFTRMLLRLFDGHAEMPRGDLQKWLRGTGSAPSDFVGRGWIEERKKIFYLISPVDMAKGWIGKQRKSMTSDYDQAIFFIGACFEGSGINASETLNNANFRPHPALGSLLTWFKTHGADSQTRNAAVTASQLYKAWEAKNQPKVKELTLFDDLGDLDGEAN